MGKASKNYRLSYKAPTVTEVKTINVTIDKLIKGMFTNVYERLNMND